MRTRTCVALGSAALLAAAGACSGERAELDAAAARGRKSYENVCIACHAPDPNLDGTLGPAVAGASLELLQAKVLRGEYPAGYAPKRPGSVMPKYPYVEERLTDIAAYLAEVARPAILGAPGQGPGQPPSLASGSLRALRACVRPGRAAAPPARPSGPGRSGWCPSRS